MKKLLALLLIISTCVFCFVGCGGVTDNPSGSSETGNGDNKETITNGIGEVFDISSYSKILKTVLTDSYYDELIVEGKIMLTTGDYSCKTANRFQAIPYGFLESEGYDVEAIKRDELKCETDIFVLDGELYIACRVENKASIDYYTHYVIKYSMTEQELSDLNLTHMGLSEGGNTIRTVSWQAPLFIQELSKQKTAVVLSKAHTTKENEEFAEEHIANDDYNVDLSDFPNNASVTFLQGYWLYPETTKIFTLRFLFYRGSSQSTPTISTKLMGVMWFTGYYTSGAPYTQIDNNEIYSGGGITQVLPEYKDDYENSKRTATFYTTYNSSFIDMEAPKYSGFYGFEKIEQ